MRDATRDSLAISGTAETATVMPPRDFNSLVTRLAQHGKICAFVDLSRADFGLHVFRAIVPEMWSDKPRFAGFDRAGVSPPSTCFRSSSEARPTRMSDHSDSSKSARPTETYLWNPARFASCAE